MTKKELLDGQEFKFENESGDIMTAEFSEHLNRFLIWFNGKIIKDPKTFRALKTNADLLIHRHNLKPVENELR